ncbi:MAG: lipoyl(octanoyl) transferase LipB [Bacteroidetes bacterium]|nr:MAG: lipoyl(octanoyl) transferase LipB [Bacteroidota bacterium]
MPSKPIVAVQYLGMQPYAAVWQQQELLLQAILAQKKSAATGQSPQTQEPPDTALGITNHLLLVQHPPVYTLGKSGNAQNLLISEQQMEAMGIEYFKINRGGDITFHGPGQLVGYPILDLEQFKTDIGWYLRSLEQVVIDTLAHFGIAAGRSPGQTGVWLDAQKPGLERKICAMGVRCSRWVTMHGWALNVNTNLDYFNHIVPCGIKNKAVTSMAHELGGPLSMDEVTARLLLAFSQTLGAHLQPNQP